MLFELQAFAKIPSSKSFIKGRLYFPIDLVNPIKDKLASYRIIGISLRHLRGAHDRRLDTHPGCIQLSWILRGNSEDHDFLVYSLLIFYRMILILAPIFLM